MITTVGGSHYIVTKSDDLEELATNVSALIYQYGWEPAGGVFLEPYIEGFGPVMSEISDGDGGKMPLFFNYCQSMYHRAR